MTRIPNDPVMLLSYVNLKLRDFYPSLEEFCEAEELDMSELTKKLAAIDYHYDRSLNSFV